MNRRSFITLLGGSAAWPLTALAQQPTMPVIGFLNSASPDQYADHLRSFRQGLGETGLVEGANVSIEYRWAYDQSDQLPTLADDLIRRRVSVIVVTGSPAALLAKAATTTIPIAFYVGVDPVQSGLVASLSRPGGNLTGVTNLAVEAGPKRLQLLHEVVPNATAIGALINPTRSNAAIEVKELQAAARVLGLTLHVVHASTEPDFEAVFATLNRVRAGGLVIAGDPFFNNRREELAQLALRHAVPAIYQFREFVAAGGLMSYGSDFGDMFRTLGLYTGRIVKGEQPADLPVQQSTKVELILNLKTAKALGLTIPLSLLGRADEVIE